MKNFVKLSEIKKLSASELSKVKGGGVVRPLYGIVIGPTPPNPLYGISPLYGIKV